MIDVKDIDPFSLPSVVLSDRDRLPQNSAIYFVLAEDEVVYVGKACNLVVRWHKHHKLRQLESLEAWLCAHQALFNQVAAFYFSVIQAHTRVLELSSKDALTALEKLTHTTERNPHPIIPLSEIREDIPAMFRRAAIHAALSSAQAFYAHLKKWHARKEKAQAKGKKFTERPPVPPRTWNKSATLYAGMWKDRTARSLVIKVWTGTCWSWLKCRLTGRELPEGTNRGSPSLVRHGTRWWLHTPVEKQFTTPPKIAQQVTTNPETKMCSVDLNLDGHSAVCTVQTAEGTILSTRFIGGGREIAGFRKWQLGRIARNRMRTGLIAEGEQDNAALWRKIRHRDEAFAHLVSRRIVQFAQEQGATILVFEHLGKLKPEKGKYSRRGNGKRAFWMKGRIFTYAKYKAWKEGILTSRVNPRNTSRECACCQAPIVRYAQGSPEEGYTVGAPLMLCPACGLRGHADRNASIVIGQRLITRYQQNRQEGKPQTPQSRTERGSKDERLGHAPKTPKRQRRHLRSLISGMEHASGMAPPASWQSGWRRPTQLSLTNYGFRLSSGYAAHTPNAAYVGVEEAARFPTAAECH